MSHPALACPFALCCTATLALSTLAHGSAFRQPALASDEGQESRPVVTVAPVPPIDLVGDVQFLLKDGVDVVLSWTSKTALILESPPVVAVASSPFGSVHLLGDESSPGDWTLYLDGAPVVELEWLEKLGVHQGPYAGMVFQANYAPVLDDIELPGGLVRILPACQGETWAGVIFEFWHLFGMLLDIDWIQFATPRLTWKGTKADGTPDEGVAPHLPGLNTWDFGTNSVSMDGSTTYVDVVAPPSSDYSDSGPGGQGENSSSMHDWPNIDDPQDAVDTLGLPPDDTTTLTSLHLHVDFTTYLLVNDMVILRIDWTFDQEVAMPYNGPYPHPNTGEVGGPGPVPPPLEDQFPHGFPVASPADGMDTDHWNALINYEMGDY